jgi:Ca-activated chloride channel family protein
MRKALSSVLLGLLLLSPACKARSTDEGRRGAATRAEAVERLEQDVRSTTVAAAPPPVDKSAAADPASQPTATTPAAERKRPAPSRPVGGKLKAGAQLADAEGGGAVAGYGRADDTSGEAYHDYGKNPWTDAAKDHLSTFAADVDTASYTIARRKLTEGTLPPAAAVRVEEFVNYFRYQFPAPTAGSPFAVVMDAVPSPLSPGRDIVRVGVATRPRSNQDRKPAHLVFLVDVSGSMGSPDKLELAKQSLRILTNNLKDGDTVAIVTYAGSSQVVLPATGLEHKTRILNAIAELTTGGSTAMGSGIDLAYQQAMAGLTPQSISRVIVCSDGDANVGAHTHQEILKLIAGRAKEGVTLSTIGFGMGNYKDETMEQLADKGNGNNFYIDSLAAAKKVFQEQLGSTLEVVAKDVKLQVDFDPTLVARYRLVGYENRDLRDEDFRNDKVDAGEIGAGHQVTALYEIERTEKGKLGNAPLGAIRVRHKQPRGEKATEQVFAMAAGPAASFANAPADLRFAFAVAAFADVLRHGQDAEHWSLAQIRDLARNASGDDADRKELVGLIEKAITLQGRAASR